MARHDVFISYTSRDWEIARLVFEALEDAGIPCWIAPRNIALETDYASELIHAIESLTAVLALDCHVEPELHRQRGYAYKETGQIDTALKDFDRAIKLRGKFAQARRDRGETLMKLMHQQEANHAIALGAHVYWVRG